MCVPSLRVRACARVKFWVRGCVCMYVFKVFKYSMFTKCFQTDYFVRVAKKSRRVFVIFSPLILESNNFLQPRKNVR